MIRIRILLLKKNKGKIRVQQKQKLLHCNNILYCNIYKVTGNHVIKKYYLRISSI